MLACEGLPLAPRTTFKVGGPAHVFAEAGSRTEIREAIEDAHRRGLPTRVLGGGSNVLVPDEGVAAFILHLSSRTLRWEGDLLIADAGATWDDVVSEACAQRKWGIENLAGIPGTVGGAVIQNIGAYGMELAETFEYADTIRLDTKAEEPVVRAANLFSYRDSAFKRNRNLVVTSVAFRVRADGTPRLSYPDLARAREAGTPLSSPAEVAKAVRDIRARKFPGPLEGGTAGSFFKNPVLDTSVAREIIRAYPDLPLFPQFDGRSKISLAWLLDHALGLKGYKRGFVRLYEKQPLVIVAEEGASARDIHVFAEDIAARVQSEFNFEIEREVETLRA